MKAALTALVLIIGAAVVLWFGNTLNSWIVGGLIGGLAALLISIPISLLIFSYLSRRHDEHLRAVAQEEMTLAQEHAYRVQPYMEPRIQMIDTYPPLLEAAADERATISRRSPMQPIPEESEYAPRGQRSASTKLPVARRGTYLPEVVRQPDASSATKKRTTRRMTYPGFPGYQPNSSFSQLQAAALRTARLEAAQQYNDIDFMPTNTTHTARRRAAGPQEQEALADYEAEMQQAQDSEHMRAVRQQTSQQQAARRATQPRPQRVIESTSSRAMMSQTAPSSEPQTDYLQDTPGTPRTGPMRQSRHLPQQTGQLGRRPHLDALPADPERETDTTGTARHTLLRRAPYTYEDDEVRQQYAQQLSDTPPVRRSSRFSSRALQQEEEEE